MNDYTFWIPLTGVGDTLLEAWQDALERVIEGISKGEYVEPPSDLFKAHDPIPAAEILGGSLSGGFGIDHGPEPDPSFHHFEDDQ